MSRRIIILQVVLILSVIGVGQQSAPGKHAKAAPPIAAGSAAKSASELPSEETVNAFLHETFGYNPSLSWKIEDIKPSEAAGLMLVTVSITTPSGLQTNQFYVTADGKHAVAGDIIPFGAHPFEAARKKLEKDGNGISRGPANAPVTIFEFSDLQCPHCKEAQPIIERFLSDEKNVRLVFQNFPLDSHDWAEKGAAYADCVGHMSNDAFWKFVKSVYEAQSDITAATSDDKLKDLANAAGVKGDEIAACAAKAATLGRVEGSVELGNAVGVNATPTLFINGREVATSERFLMKF